MNNLLFIVPDHLESMDNQWMVNLKIYAAILIIGLTLLMKFLFGPPRKNRFIP